jgi:hypothetical protein
LAASREEREREPSPRGEDEEEEEKAKTSLGHGATTTWHEILIDRFVIKIEIDNNWNYNVRFLAMLRCLPGPRDAQKRGERGREREREERTNEPQPKNGKTARAWMDWTLKF